MLTKADIKRKYQIIHDDLTKQFYVDKSIDAVAFNAGHEKCWQDMEQELLDNGFLAKTYHYTFGATIDTPIGSIDVKVTVISPVQLTPAQITNSRDKLKTADWQLLETKETLTEV